MFDIFFDNIIFLGIISIFIVIVEAILLFMKRRELGRTIKENINMLVPVNIIGVPFAAYILFIFPSKAGVDTIKLSNSIVEGLTRIGIDSAFTYIFLNPVIPAIIGTWICFLIIRPYFPAD